jgi:hypothetical protein
MPILLKNAIKALTIGAVASALLLINTQDVFARSVLTCSCEVSSSSGSCGSCSYKGAYCKPSGGGGIKCEYDDVKASDFGLNIGLTSMEIPDEQNTSAFFPLDTISKRGKGYINATVLYNQGDSGDVDVYLLCNAIEIEDYDEWLAVCKFLYGTDTPNNLVSVYPNPTSANAYVKLNDNYLHFVKSASYQLISPSGSPITTFAPSNIAETIDIPAKLLTTRGVYTIKCNVEYLDANNTLTNTTLNIPFSVLLMVTE